MCTRARGCSKPVDSLPPPLSLCFNGWWVVCLSCDVHECVIYSQSFRLGEKQKTERTGRDFAGDHITWNPNQSINQSIKPYSFYSTRLVSFHLSSLHSPHTHLPIPSHPIPSHAMSCHVMRRIIPIHACRGRVWIGWGKRSCTMPIYIHPAPAPYAYQHVTFTTQSPPSNPTTPLSTSRLPSTPFHLPLLPVVERQRYPCVLVWDGSGSGSGDGKKHEQTHPSTLTIPPSIHHLCTSLHIPLYIGIEKHLHRAVLCATQPVDVVWEWGVDGVEFVIVVEEKRGLFVTRVQYTHSSTSTDTLSPNTNPSSSPPPTLSNYTSTSLTTGRIDLSYLPSSSLFSKLHHGAIDRDMPLVQAMMCALKGMKSENTSIPYIIDCTAGFTTDTLFLISTLPSPIHILMLECEQLVCEMIRWAREECEREGEGKMKEWVVSE